MRVEIESLAVGRIQILCVTLVKWEKQEVCTYERARP